MCVCACVCVVGVGVGGHGGPLWPTAYVVMPNGLDLVFCRVCA